MASQNMSTGKSQKTAAAATPARESGRRSGSGAPPASTGGTPERNETYGLVSVLYHALQGAETYTQYINDARQAADQELVEFFEECRDELNEQALRARQLLATRLEDDIEEEDDEDEDEDEDE